MSEAPRAPRWRPGPGFAGRAIVLAALATLPWLVWLAWPAGGASRSSESAPPVAEAAARLASLSEAVSGWEVDASAIASDPVVTAALAVGDDGGLSDLLANHETASRYANALVVDADYRVRAFARPTRWAGLRVPRAGDPLARVLEASRIADGPALSPLAASGSAAVLYVAAPLRDGDRRLGTLVLVAGPGQFAALLDGGPASGITHEVLVAIDGAWHRLEAAGAGDARLARRPADAELDRLLVQATTGAEASGLLATQGGGAPVVARSFAPLNAVIVVARAPGEATSAQGPGARPSALWPMAAAIGLALALALIWSRREPEPATTAKRPRRREPRLTTGSPEAGARVEAAPAREALVATLGPELRAPLAAILGTAELAATEATEPRLAVRIGRIRSSAGALLDYLDDLALLAGLEAGHAPARREPFRLRDALADVASRCAAEVAAAGSELVLRRGAGVPDALVGDRERLAEALVRLVRATLPRLPAGRSLRIEFEAPRSGDAGDGDGEQAASSPILCATVHATDVLLAGEGLFDGATPIDGRDGGFPGAAAIGVAIAARAAESMGAEVLWAADSEPPAFRFEFPLVAAPEAEAARPSLRGRRALVVDELGVSAEVLAEMLARAGLEVHETPTMAAAAAEIRRSVPPRAKPYDLLLVDDRVPDLARLAALIEGRREGRALPPVVLLGTPGRAPGQAASADARIDRPLDESAVLEVIAGALGLGPAVPWHPVEPATPVVPDDALAGRRLLLVDDNPMNREVGVELLQRAGAAVDIAVDGRAALDVLAAGRAYDAVLMDLEMPRMDGLEATRAIRALPNRGELPIIAWTAHALPEDRARCLEAGMSDYLPKPVALDRLYATVARWTGGPASVAGAADEGTPERIDATDQPPLDAASAVRFLGDDEPLYHRLLATFAAEHEGDAGRIRAAIAAGRRAEAREATHALKGLAATLGMAPLARVAASIELSLRAGSAVPDAVLDALHERLAEALAAAADWLANHSPRPVPLPVADIEASGADREAQWSLLDAQIARGELGALGTFESLAASRRGELDDAEWEAVHDALVHLDFERAAALRRRLG
jgi:CheY-like chemotaxis protein/signal transduction histidine kinase